MRINVAVKVNILAIILVLISMIFVGWFFTWNETRLLTREMDERAAAITRNFAYNSEYGLLVGDKNELYRLLEGILKEKNIVYAAIRDNTGDIVVQLGERKKQPPQSAGVGVKEFSAPVLTKTVTKEEVGLVIVRTPGTKKKNGGKERRCRPWPYP